MKLVCFVFAVVLAFTVVAHGQDPKAKKNPAPQQSKESFWQWALRFTGISATPNTLKGAGDELVSGQVWLVDLPSATRRRITADDGYRSPIYFSSGFDMLALHGATVVRISNGGAKIENLYNIAGITKLVGFSRDAPGEVLALTEDDAGHVAPARLTLSTGTITPVPYDPQSDYDHQMLEHLEGWQRSYGETVVYVKRESKQALSGPVEVFNVFLKAPGREPVNVSNCDAANCGQPSLSPDGNRVLFIRAAL